MRAVYLSGARARVYDAYDAGSGLLARVALQSCALGQLWEAPAQK